MKIGIIGAGEMGGTLIRQYSKAGHSVKMANSSRAEKLKSLSLETGASAVKLAEVVTDVDVVVITIPLIAILKLPQHLFENTSANTTIIDTCNYYPIRDGIIEDIENGMPESVWVSTQLQRPVIKAYNSILYRSLVNSGLPKGTASRLALPISGDDKQSKDLVSILVDDSGFDSLDYGSLQDSWRQQPGSPVYCTDLTLTQLKKSIEKARKELLPERRELGLKFILKHDPELWMDNVKYNRKIYESDLEHLSSIVNMIEVNIETYTDINKKDVTDLILHIQNVEFGIPITLELQPDLNEIPGFYQTNSGNFWIAKNDDKIIGTISLLDIGNRKGALRKIFVDKNYRGKEFGVGQKLLNTLVGWTKHKGFTEIFLGTTEKFIAAQRFYEKNGFKEIEKQELPETFPVMEVDIKFYRFSV